MGLEIYNDKSGKLYKRQGSNHFTSSERRPYLGTTETTIKNPDISFIANGKPYYIKKYLNTISNEPVFDFVFLKDGKLFNKIPTYRETYISNQMTKPMKDLSFHKRMRDISEPTGGISTLYNNNVIRNGVVVNSELPNVSTLYEGLTPEQVQVH